MRKKGFTLIELLATIAIISLLVTAAMGIFSINIKANKNIFQKEIDYKESSIAMMYIDNIIKSAYKIEFIDDTGETNFKAYVLDKNSHEISSVYFKTSKSQNEKKYLMAVRDNISNKSVRNGTIRIANCNDLYLYYDRRTDIVTVILNKDTNFKQESKIFLGDRL
ncbi:type II secretion system protein [Anaerococcus cruorum]|uniref:Type II secretion system protein n=1 Tax=Anaerococcus cruorum TaxID=3115617 RepID=A0ABW9MVU4_9FIRM